MRNVILFILAAAATLVADAKPSTGHAQIVALLRRQLPGSSTSSTGSSSFPGLNPSSIGVNSKCQTPCSPFTNTNAVTACSEQVSCLCGQQNYNSLSSCLQCASPSSPSDVLNSFVSSCQQLGYSLSPPSGSNSGTTSPGTTSSGTNSPGANTPNTNSTGSTGSNSPLSGNQANPLSSSLSQFPTVTGPRSGDSTPSTANSPAANGVATKSNGNGGVVRPNAFGSVGLSGVAAVVVMIATLGASFV